MKEGLLEGMIYTHYMLCMCIYCYLVESPPLNGMGGNAFHFSSPCARCVWSQRMQASKANAHDRCRCLSSGTRQVPENHKIPDSIDYWSAHEPPHPLLGSFFFDLIAVLDRTPATVAPEPMCTLVWTTVGSVHCSGRCSGVRISCPRARATRQRLCRTRGECQEEGNAQ